MPVLERDPGSLFPKKLRMMHSPAMMTAAKRKPGEQRRRRRRVSGVDQERQRTMEIERVLVKMEENISRERGVRRGSKRRRRRGLVRQKREGGDSKNAVKKGRWMKE